MIPTPDVGRWVFARPWGLSWMLGLWLGVCSLCPAEDQPQVDPAPPLEAQEPSPATEKTPEPAVPAIVIPPEIAAAVAELVADEFTVRQRAESRLIAMGGDAFPPLLAVLDRASPETGRRVLLVLEQIWLQAPQPLADDLEQQLDQLSFSQSPFQADVEQMLQSHHRLREERAARTLRRLNAIIQLDEDENAKELLIKFGELDDMPRQRIASVIFPRSWKGTSADLWHLRRLSHTDVLHVYVIRGNGITDAEMQAMNIGYPELSVSERSEIFIGVTGQPIGFDNRIGCPVSTVQTDSPADIAGIEVGDLIQKVDGVEIRSFQELVEQLKSKRGYQPIEIMIERFRGEEPMLITVIGLPWEVRRFERPPQPPQSESLTDPPVLHRGRSRFLPN